MGIANKTVALFFFMLYLNLLYSSLVAASNPNNNQPPTPPPPSTYIGSSSPPTGGAPTCPLTILSLRACVNVLNGGLPVVIGNGSVRPCCTLVQGLADVEAGLCLCAALKASALNVTPGIILKITLPILLSACGRNPSNTQCS